MKKLLTLAIATALLLTPITARAQAVRITVDGVCGSGSIAGYDERGAYILTNAHVAGTRIGRVVNVDYPTFGNAGRATVKARIIAAAYSDRTLTDWAILLAPELKSGSQWKISTTLPSDREHQTTGSPRCIWPQTSQRTQTRSITNSNTLWRWQPTSIGGQSGSSVRTTQGVTKGLLTWSWAGDGAGQTTESIYRQFRTRTVSDEVRPQELIELNDKRSPTENGVFTEASIAENATIADLPIWVTPSDPTPPTDVTPPTDNCCKCCKPCTGPAVHDDHALAREMVETRLDIQRLIKLILQLIELFQTREQTAL